MRIFLDVTRTLIHIYDATVTGIDRVEHAYITYFLDSPLDWEVWFILTTSYGKAALSRSEMRAEMDKFAESANQKQQKHEGFEVIATVLQRPVPAGLQKSSRLILNDASQGRWRAYLNIGQLLIRGRWRFERLVRRPVPTIYYHTSHTGLEKSERFQWLERDRIKSVFFIHDLIPIQYPEFCPDIAAERHRARMRTVRMHADAIIANSEFTAASIKDYLPGEANLNIPVVVAPLANSISDQQPVSDQDLAKAHPYFLHVGTLEGRKNVGHLLNVWRTIIARLGHQAAPRLLLVGKRGWECETVVDLLERSHELANHVVEASGVSDQQLLRLMLASQGLISVSFVEGYGLPPVEAMRHGIPVIASDIPAHREVLGSQAEFVDPTDGPGLVAAVIRVMGSQSLLRNSLTRSLPPGLSWEEHVKKAVRLTMERLLEL
ncbi:glycosyltransferase family 4 protein [Ensifer aridi]|uniref:glycosyltransferase family 4 protein n=1 Tax=Ensifer aridi TaxID=1708715 RepID=UPI0015530FAD|nr:glycosyltransferase family 1 protein [Ensifer aridi]